MGYTYDQRKRPQWRENTAPERATAPGPAFNALLPGTSAPQNAPSFDLDAAMKAIPIPRDDRQVEAWLKECGGSQE